MTRIILAFVSFATTVACQIDEVAVEPQPTPAATAAPTPSPSPSPITVTQFGFAAIACDHDDPFDPEVKTDYSNEVASFTNLNQVCPTGDITTDAARLASTAQSYDPLYYIEPVFFDAATGKPRPADEASTLWQGQQAAIAQSGVDPSRIVFYLFDEPTLRGVTMAFVEGFADEIRAAYPSSKLLIVEAYSPSEDPIVPDFVDLWGFNAYTVRDPVSNEAYTGFLDRAAAQLSGKQALVLIGDGIHTPFHLAEGISEADMAEVAQNYAALAAARDDVAALLVYTWAGGIDNLNERGTRNLPSDVRDAWAEIGKNILGD